MPVSEPDSAPAEVVRRAPFGDNPELGARGQRTRQRILDAALDVLGDSGYHGATIRAITDRAGCSRAALYQYFGSKEDVFRELAGTVARELGAAIDALAPITADAAGRTAVRDWVASQAETYTRFAPVFGAFDDAARADAAVASGSARWGSRAEARILERVTAPDLPERLVAPTIALLRDGINRALEMVSIIRAAAPDSLPAPHLVEQFADVVHRSLFGALTDVNVHDAAPAPSTPPPPATDPDEPATSGERWGRLTPVGRHTLDALLRAGEDVLVERGYHLTRVDDVVARAGVSHGAFYQYFESKDDLARHLGTGAVRATARIVGEVPTATPDGPPAVEAVRAWLDRYQRTQLDEAALLRVWVDAAVQDTGLRTASAPSLEWGRRHLAAALRPRGFGDPDTDGLFLLALLSQLGSTERTPHELDAATTIVHRALFGAATLGV